ncbi:MAG: ABC transporter ATP-binding protein [Bacteroidota bacterium]|nr:ABC transporter ATP-binding protein [Bacteroidota bacterium]
MKHKLEADSIQLAFNNRKILSDIYLKCETGKITGLVGRNGQGKSCLMQIIYGSLKCEKSVRIDNLSQPEAFKKPDFLKYLPQFNFIPKQLSLKRIFKDYELDYSPFEKKFPEFASKYKSSIGSLSGGENRIVELYVIVKSKSQFAMLDEPFTHLSPVQTEKIKELLTKEKANKGLLITDHMFNHVTEIADAIYVLVNGKTHLINNLEEIEILGYVRF